MADRSRCAVRCRRHEVVRERPVDRGPMSGHIEDAS
jgi:hypothetical protein